MSPKTPKLPLFVAISILLIASLACTLSAGPNGVVLDTSDTPATAVATTEAPVASNPTAAPVTSTPHPTEAPAQPLNSCPQARDLGPWAPTASGEGITFEVTASDQGASNLSSNGVVLGLWFPAGNTAWGTKEITTFVPRGMSITVINGAGRGWDYEATCDSAEVTRQMEAHMAARKNDTSYFDFVSLKDLISAGLVEVRFDRSSNPTP